MSFWDVVLRCRFEMSFWDVVLRCRFEMSSSNIRQMKQLKCEIFHRFEISLSYQRSKQLKRENLSEHKFTFLFSHRIFFFVENFFDSWMRNWTVVGIFQSFLSFVLCFCVCIIIIPFLTDKQYRKRHSQQGIFQKKTRYSNLIL